MAVFQSSEATRFQTATTNGQSESEKEPANNDIRECVCVYVLLIQLNSIPSLGLTPLPWFYRRRAVVVVDDHRTVYQTSRPRVTIDCVGAGSAGKQLGLAMFLMIENQSGCRWTEFERHAVIHKSSSSIMRGDVR